MWSNGSNLVADSDKDSDEWLSPRLTGASCFPWAVSDAPHCFRTVTCHGFDSLADSASVLRAFDLWTLSYGSECWLLGRFLFSP